MAKQKYGQTALDRGLEEAKDKGGGIQAGSHPEFEQATPLEKVGAFVKGVVAKFNGSGSHTSPSTKRYK